MSAPIADPDRPGVWLVGCQTVHRVHSADRCVGGGTVGCVFHRPTNHPMQTWPLRWRGDRRLMERLCPHGIGHPDPDQLPSDTLHGCDGCCAGQEAGR